MKASKDSRRKLLFVANVMNVGGIEKSLLGLLRVLPPERFDITLALISRGSALDADIPPYVRVIEIKPLQEYSAEVGSPMHAVVTRLKTGRIGEAIGLTWSRLRSAASGSNLPFYDYLLRKGSGIEGQYDVAISYAGPSELLDWVVARHVDAKRRLGWIHFDVTQVRLVRKAARRAYAGFDRIFVVAEGSRDVFVKEFPHLIGRTRVFHNIVDPVSVRRSAGLYTLTALPEGVVRIVTVGRLHPLKGHDLAVRAAALLKKRGLNFVWHFVGGGAMEPELRHLASELDVAHNIIFEGVTTNPYPFMEAADVYVQPSRSEGYCITLAEARCFGAPIVSTRFPGVEQLDGRPHTHVVDTDPEAIAAGIEAAIADGQVTTAGDDDYSAELDQLINYLSL